MTNDFSIQVVVCVHRHLDPDCWNSLWALSRCVNPKVTLTFCHGDAMLPRARSLVASKFLQEKKHDVLMFIDDDMVFDPVDAIKVAALAYIEKLDIVGGVYVTKSETSCHPQFIPNDGEIIDFRKDGVAQEVRMINTGFMAIRRETLEKIVEKDLVHLCHPKSLAYYPFFSPREEFIDGEWWYLSEDWGFCHLARSICLKVWIDTSIRLKHIGKYKYDLDDCLKTMKTHHEVIRYWQEDGKAVLQDLSQKSDAPDKGVEGCYQHPQGEK